MMAWQVISDERRFTQGTCCRSLGGESLPTNGQLRPWKCDCLGAILWAYKDYDPEASRRHLKVVFETCKARHGHKRLGQLGWEEALDLLKACGV